MKQLTDKGTYHAYFQQYTALPHITYNFIPTYINTRFEFLTVHVKVTVLQNVKLCSLLCMYRCFRDTCCHYCVAVMKLCSINKQSEDTRAIMVPERERLYFHCWKNLTMTVYKHHSCILGNSQCQSRKQGRNFQCMSQIALSLVKVLCYWRVSLAAGTVISW